MAEEVKTGVEAQGVPQAEPKVTPEIDYDKLSALLDKRRSTAEQGVLKSYFEQQGLSGEEVSTAIAEYKAAREREAGEEAQAAKTLEAENQKLKAELQRMKLETAAREQAGTLGADAESIPYLMRLADFDGAVSDSGDIDAEKVKTALEKVLTDLPALKKQQDTGFQQVGAGPHGEKPKAEQEPSNPKRWNRFR